MTIFPALIPSTRTYSPGEFPHTPHSTYSGEQVRVRHSNAVMGVRLRLFFPAITTTELLQVKAHHAGQSGGFLPFQIPDELLSGVTTPADFTPRGQQWKYVGRVQVKDIPVEGSSPSNLHDVTVELEAVPSSPVVFVPRSVTRLSVLAPSVIGTPPSSVDVPAVSYQMSVLAPTVEAVGAPSDPDFASVSLLLPLDTANGLADLSSNGFTVTAFGDAAITTSDSDFPGGALGLDGAGDYLTTPADAAFAFGTGDFTVEGYLKADTVTDNDGIFCFGTTQLFLALFNGDWRAGTTGSNGDNYGAATAGTRQHFALTRASGTIRFFVGGTQLAFAVRAENLTNNIMNIGYYFDPLYPFDGRLSWLRVTKGVARYTSAFTPPATPFPTS